MINVSHVSFRIADVSDIPLLVDMRLQFVAELKKCDDSDQLDELKTITERYVTEHVSNNSYIGFLGYYNNEAICCAGLLLYDLPPLIGNMNRTRGHVLNFYTVPKYRKKGVGNALLYFIILHAKEKGINSLFLNATKDGEHLYRASGFAESEEKAMVLYL